MAVGRPATARTRLLLAPGAGLSQPRGWAALANQPALISSVPFSRTHTTVDEVHCVGGGSLLLWLLACAGKAPRGRTVYMHGPVVLPTPAFKDLEAQGFPFVVVQRWEEVTPGLLEAYLKDDVQGYGAIDWDRVHFLSSLEGLAENLDR